MSKLPANAVGVMDRGFAGLKFIQQLVQGNKYFVLRIKNNWKLEFESESRLTKIGSSTDAQAYKTVNFCDVETKTEFRLVTNLPDDGDAAVSDDEIRDIYRLRWGVELFWKFLKMHLKLERLISKSLNGITIQPEMLNFDTKLYISRYSKTNQVKFSTKHEFLKPMNKTNFLTHTSLMIANFI